jgi:hypothetical protein
MTARGLTAARDDGYYGPLMRTTRALSQYWWWTCSRMVPLRY